MTQALCLRCRCGAVRGVLSGVVAAEQKRVVCYCDDCQIYAHQLGRADVLDAHGGTDVVISTPAQVHFTQGMEQLRCMRLSPKGLYRWYAACCRTPIGNAIGPRVPALMVALVAVDLEGTGKSADETVGLPAARIQARFARGGMPAGAHAKSPAGLLVKVAGHLLGSLLRGRAQPSPFFDAEGQPRVAPQLIDKAEREATRARVLAQR